MFIMVFLPFISLFRLLINCFSSIAYIQIPENCIFTANPMARDIPSSHGFNILNHLLWMFEVAFPAFWPAWPFPTLPYMAA